MYMRSNPFPVPPPAMCASTHLSVPVSQTYERRTRVAHVHTNLFYALCTRARTRARRVSTGLLEHNLRQRHNNNQNQSYFNAIFLKIKINTKMHEDQNSEMVKTDLTVRLPDCLPPRASPRGLPSGGSGEHAARPAGGLPGACANPPQPAPTRAPCPLRDPKQPLPAALTVTASHWPPGLGGPARTPTHSHQRTNEMVATQLLWRLRGGRAAQSQYQGRAQQHQRPGERARVHSGRRRPSPGGTPLIGAQPAPAGDLGGRKHVRGPRERVKGRGRANSV